MEIWNPRTKITPKGRELLAAILANPSRQRNPNQASLDREVLIGVICKDRSECMVEA